MERRRVIAISLNEKEKALAVQCSSRIGASVSQLFRIALIEYAANHEKIGALGWQKEADDYAREH